MLNNESEISQDKIEYIGMLLREVRRHYGYNQQEVAEQIKSHRNSISRLENGKNFTIKLLIKVTKFYNIPINELLADVD